MIRYKTDIQFELEYTQIESAHEVTENIISRYTVFVIDFSNEWEISTRLQSLANPRQFVHIMMDSYWVPVSGINDEWSFPGMVHPIYAA